MNRKIQKKIENIIALQEQIRNWKEKTEDEVADAIKMFEKAPREEVSTYYIPYFTDTIFANTLLEIAKSYPNNQKITLNVIFSLSNMILRYKLEETSEFYEFVLQNATKKSLAGYIAIYLPRLNGFKAYPDKWEYFMSMQKMTPKQTAHANFVSIIQNNIDTIPADYKKEIITFLEEKEKIANNEGGKKYYRDMIDTINSN